MFLLLLYKMQLSILTISDFNVLFSMTTFFLLFPSHLTRCSLMTLNLPASLKAAKSATFSLIFLEKNVSNFQEHNYVAKFGV